MTTTSPLPNNTRSAAGTKETAQQRWARIPVIRTGEDYLASIRDRGTRLFLFGELVDEPADHPIIKPSINALKATYDLAIDEPEVATAWSPLIDAPVNRFLHIAESPDDLMKKHAMQRRLGQLTGTCFQRCTGLDTISVLHSVTYELDEKYGTEYHQRYLRFLEQAQRKNVLIAVGMTDPKGDRSKPPHLQADPDMFLRVVRRDEDGVYLRGAKAHMTGGWNQHWMCVVPTMNLGPDDRDYAIVGLLPIDAPGLTYIYGRQASDTRALEPGTLDQGNATFGGQEVLVWFDDVFVPWEHVMMDGETEFATTLVSRFTAYHRASYVCKTGLGDVLTGAAAEVADMNGVAKASHIKDKIVEMVHLNETIYSSSIASAAKAKPLASGIYMNDEILSNVCKHNVTRFPYEIARLAQDLAGGIVVTMPSEADLRHEEVGPLLEKLLAGRADIPTEDRMRILRLIENMTLGRNAVGYLTESMHGAGSPQGQRVVLQRLTDLDGKRALARELAGIRPTSTEEGHDDSDADPR
ncbi:4-hydroxyphenylacetate 3-hydroxylase family protein [Amycolatopsis thermoflava]|uniref:4-hydroxyphenylacetate 3-hydroxylase family protein n=1 Tax=Amycolatopsis thermoflava TaxID=84480 RepID=UPI0038196C6F